MTDARTNILARLRHAETSPVAPPEDFQVVAAEGWTAEERLERLRRMMESVKTEFLDARGGDWVALLAAWCADEKIDGMVYGPDSPTGQALAAGWPDSAAAGSFSGAPCRLIPYDRAMADWKDQLFAHAGAGITGTEGGIAQTGSLIVRTGPDEPRTLSLVPPVHVAVLDVSRLCDTLWQAMGEQNWAAGMPTNMLLISGPSKTADIEQTLAYGVHGPKRLLVVLVDS